MRIDIDTNSGFCNGVIRAINMAENALEKGGILYSLGDIVHNEVEVSRLNAFGLQSIGKETFEQLKDQTVLIRAHGEPPATYAKAEENNLKIIDATCPVVLGLQRQVSVAYRKSLEDNGQVVIFGKAGHAEVVGLEGQTQYSAKVVGTDFDLTGIDFNRPIRLFSQTTMSIQGFEALSQLIEDRIRETGSNAVFEKHCTICHQVAGRELGLEVFANSHEVIIFVTGKKSSNGKVLFNICKRTNPKSYMVSAPQDIDLEWFRGISTVGVCGATSTPLWLMEKCCEYLKENIKND